MSFLNLEKVLEEKNYFENQYNGLKTKQGSWNKQSSEHTKQGPILRYWFSWSFTQKPLESFLKSLQTFLLRLYSTFCHFFSI